MESKQIGNKVYLRVEKGEDVLDSVLRACEAHSLKSATFQGIGACSKAGIQTYIPEKNDFIQSEVSGMLEMVSLMGNVTLDSDGKLFEHTHALFAYLDEAGEHRSIAGHLHSAEVGYTAEIVIDPVEGVINRKFDDKAGITVWNLEA